MLSHKPVGARLWHQVGPAAVILTVVAIGLLSVLVVHHSDADRLLVSRIASASSVAQNRTRSSCANGSVPRVAFVTGINGMIGSHVARALLASHRACYHVVGMIRPRLDLSSLAGVIDQIEFVQGDIADSHRLITIIQQVAPDVVFHFAAQAINGISLSIPQVTVDSNVQGTINLFEAIRRWGRRPRVLVAGSSTEYGQAAEQNAGPIPETLILDPVTPYGISKAATEKLANQYVIAAGIPAVTARLFIHVGVGGTDSLAIHQFCKQTALAELGLAEPVIRHGNLETARDITDARDSAPVLIQLAEEGVAGEAYNVGSGNTIHIKDLLENVIKLARVPMSHEQDPALLRPFDEKVLVADISKIRKLTGWHPATDMSATVANILAYWRRKVQTLYCVEGADDVNPCRNQPAPTGGAVVERVAEKCPFADVDLWVPLHEPEFPLLALLVNSIGNFMPCFNTLHVVVDRADAAKSLSWVVENQGVNGIGRIQINAVDVPEAVSILDGYIIQAWRMLWADQFSESTGARYVMLLDTDSVFAMPVTCQSVFDDEGRIYSLSWSIERQKHFQQPCIELIGGSCERSYMSTFPFTLPVEVFAPMREFIRERIGAPTFDEAFATWAQRTAKWRYFSQFVVMGEYMRIHHPDMVRQVFCPLWVDGVDNMASFYASDDTSLCLNHVPLMVHLGWGNNGYINGGTGNTYRRNDAGEFNRYSDKYGVATIDAIQAMTTHGICLRDHWAGKDNPLCKGVDTTTLYPDVNLYGNKRQLNWSLVEERFAPDIPGQLCSDLFQKSPA